MREKGKAPWSPPYTKKGIQAIERAFELYPTIRFILCRSGARYRKIDKTVPQLTPTKDEVMNHIASGENWLAWEPKSVCDGKGYLAAFDYDPPPPGYSKKEKVMLYKRQFMEVHGITEWLMEEATFTDGHFHFFLKSKEPITSNNFGNWCLKRGRRGGVPVVRPEQWTLEKFADAFVIDEIIPFNENYDELRV